MNCFSTVFISSFQAAFEFKLKKKSLGGEHTIMKSHYTKALHKTCWNYRVMIKIKQEKYDPKQNVPFTE